MHITAPPKCDSRSRAHTNLRTHTRTRRVFGAVIAHLYLSRTQAMRAKRIHSKRTGNSNEWTAGNRSTRIGLCVITLGAHNNTRATWTTCERAIRNDTLNCCRSVLACLAINSNVFGCLCVHDLTVNRARENVNLFLFSVVFHCRNFQCVRISNSIVCILFCFFFHFFCRRFSSFSMNQMRWLIHIAQYTTE